MFPPRVSRGLRLLIGLGLLAGSCSHRSRPTAAPTVSPSATAATVTASVSPTGSSPPLAPPAPSPTPAPSKSPTHVATPTPPPRTAPTPSSPAPPPGSRISVPKLGTYVYNLSGSTQSPLLGIPQSYQPGATLNVNFFEANPQPAGTEVGAKATTSQDQVQTTTRWIWEPSKVVLSSANLTFLGLASYDCAYTPAPEILPNPLVAGSLPAQSWSNSQCSGSLTVSVLDAETVTAAGQSWNVWRVHTVLHYVAQSSVDVTGDTTTLFSPELGTIITNDATSSGTVAGAAFSSHQVTTLASHP